MALLYSGKYVKIIPVAYTEDPKVFGSASAEAPRRREMVDLKSATPYYMP